MDVAEMERLGRCTYNNIFILELTYVFGLVKLFLWAKNTFIFLFFALHEGFVTSCT
jgi:hypothetical protein